MWQPTTKRTHQQLCIATQLFVFGEALGRSEGEINATPYAYMDGAGGA